MYSQYYLLTHSPQDLCKKSILQTSTSPLRYYLEALTHQLLFSCGSDTTPMAASKTIFTFSFFCFNQMQFMMINFSNLRIPHWMHTPASFCLSTLSIDPFRYWQNLQRTLLNQLECTLEVLRNWVFLLVIPTNICLIIGCSEEI